MIVQIGNANPNKSRRVMTTKPKKLNHAKGKVNHKVYVPPTIHTPTLYEEIFGMTLSALRQIVLDQEERTVPARPAFNNLATHLGLDNKQTLTFLGWQRQHSKFDKQTLDRLLGLLRAFDQARQLLGDEAKAWFQESPQYLYGRSPLEVSRYATGVDKVMRLLCASEDGTYL
jgi:hypothetical protein